MPWHLKDPAKIDKPKPATLAAFLPADTSRIWVGKPGDPVESYGRSASVARSSFISNGHWILKGSAAWPALVKRWETGPHEMPPRPYGHATVRKVFGEPQGQTTLDVVGYLEAWTVATSKLKSERVLMSILHGPGFPYGLAVAHHYCDPLERQGFLFADSTQLGQVAVLRPRGVGAKYEQEHVGTVMGLAAWSFGPDSHGKQPSNGVPLEALNALGFALSRQAGEAPVRQASELLADVVGVPLRDELYRSGWKAFLSNFHALSLEQRNAMTAELERQFAPAFGPPNLTLARDAARKLEAVGVVILRVDGGSGVLPPTVEPAPRPAPKPKRKRAPKPKPLPKRGDGAATEARDLLGRRLFGLAVAAGARFYFGPDDLENLARVFRSIGWSAGVALESASLLQSHPVGIVVEVPAHRTPPQVPEPKRKRAPKPEPEPKPKPPGRTSPHPVLESPTEFPMEHALKVPAIAEWIQSRRVEQWIADVSRNAADARRPARHHVHREPWLHDAAGILGAWVNQTRPPHPLAFVEAAGGAFDTLQLSDLRLSVSFPLGARSSKSVIGVCYYGVNFADGKPQLIVSPVLADDGGPQDVLGVLLHELIHAACQDCAHGRGYKRHAVACGLEGKMTATTTGEHLAHVLRWLTVWYLGPYPHAVYHGAGDGTPRKPGAPQPGSDGPKRQPTRQRKWVCSDCGAIIRAATDTLEAGHVPRAAGSQGSVTWDHAHAAPFVLEEK